MIAGPKTSIASYADVQPLVPHVGVTVSHRGQSWYVERNIYSGPFSEVFMICDARNPVKKYAMKVEKIVGIPRPVLKLDALVLPQLAGHPGFPEFIAAGKTSNYKYMIMQMLGPDLGKLKMCLPYQSFSIETALCVSLQALDRLQTLHHVGWLCRDVKTQNLAVGRGFDSGTVYMLDFGFARRFRTSSNSIRDPRPSTALLGTMRYASLAAHLSQDQCPRDDLESWFYMTLELIAGRLPWHGQIDHQAIYEAKIFYRHAGRSILLSPIKNEEARRYFDLILKNIDNVSYYDNPDYRYLRYLLQQMVKEMNLDLSKPLDWQTNTAAYQRAEYYEWPEDSPKEKKDQQINHAH